MTADPTNQFWNREQLPVHEHTCNVCGVKTMERLGCTIIMKPDQGLLNLLCNQPAVFHCAGKCKQSFCSFHAYNTGGYCPDCWPLDYPDGALRTV